MTRTCIAAVRLCRVTPLTKSHSLILIEKRVLDTLVYAAVVHDIV